MLRVTGEEVERFASIHGDLPISISKIIVPSGFKLTQDESFFCKLMGATFSLSDKRCLVVLFSSCCSKTVNPNK